MFVVFTVLIFSTSTSKNQKKNERNLHLFFLSVEKKALLQSTNILSMPPTL